MAVKGTKIDGDVTIGRNSSTGGDADVAGNARVGHDLRVEGWLDAPNIKGPDKGMFPDEATLYLTYPLPRNGWRALVGTKFPAAIYLAKNGKWYDTHEKYENPSVHLTDYATKDTLDQQIANQDQKFEELKESVQSQINDYQPIINNGNVTNAADEEDITSNEHNLLQFKDRNNLNGMGYKILRRGGTGILEPNALGTGNTIYEIKYDFDLNGQTLNVGQNCILNYNGGSLKNGKIVYNNTKTINKKNISVEEDGILSDEQIKLDADADITYMLENSVSANQTVDLNGFTATINSQRGFGRVGNILIQNGKLHIQRGIGLRKKISFGLNHIDLFFNSEKGAFVYGTSKEGDSSELKLGYSRFFNTSIKQIGHLIKDYFTKVVVDVCEFYDCGISCRTDAGKTEWNPSSLIHISKSLFAWDKNKDANRTSGNIDGIACGSFDNIFISACTFYNLGNSVLDCYTSSNIIFTGNKLVDCYKGIELKSQYRSQNISEGAGQGNLPRNNNFVISGNIFDNTTYAISMTMAFENVEGIIDYFLSKSEKWKRNLIISGNIFNYDKMQNNKSYVLSGDPILNMRFTDNIVYSDAENIIFWRDNFTNRFEHIHTYRPKTLIKDSSFIYTKGCTDFMQLAYPDYTFEDCHVESPRPLPVKCVGNDGVGYSLQFKRVNNLSVYLSTRREQSNVKDKIRMSFCEGITTYVGNFDLLANIDNSTSSTFRYGGGLNTEHNTYVYNSVNSDLIIRDVNNESKKVYVCADKNSLVRKDVSVARNLNYHYIKQFETYEEIKNLGANWKIALYINADTNTEYHFDAENWRDSNGYFIAKKMGGKSDRPSVIQDGYSFLDSSLVPPQMVFRYRNGKTGWIKADGTDA